MAGACVYKTISYALGVIDRISDGHKAAANRIPLRLLVHCNQRGVRMPMDVQAACERFDMTLVSLLDMNEILREDSNRLLLDCLIVRNRGQATLPQYCAVPA
jgi:hypothetical protein